MKAKKAEKLAKKQLKATSAFEFVEAIKASLKNIQYYINTVGDAIDNLKCAEKLHKKLLKKGKVDNKFELKEWKISLTGTSGMDGEYTLKS